MGRLGLDMTFGAVALLLMAATLFMFPVQEPTGMVYGIPKEHVIPNIDLIAPDKDVVSYNVVQNFLFRVNSVDYDVDCNLVLNDAITPSKSISSGVLGEFKLDIDPGYYKWRVECRLLNGRTISSIENSLRVESHEAMQDAFKVTGRVTDTPVKQDPKGLIIALLALAVFVWTVNLRRS